MKEKGFTLIEILIVVTMLVMIMIAIMASMSSVFKAQTRVTLSNKAIQNGNSALDEIKKNILNAKGTGISCPPSDIGSSIIFTNAIDGQTTNLTCLENNKIASISAIRVGETIDLTSSNDVMVKNCLFFVKCNRNSANTVSNLEFNFTVGTGTTVAGLSNQPNYFEKDFSSKVTVRN